MNRTDSLELFWRPIVNQFLTGATVLPPFLGLEETAYFSLLEALNICDVPEQHQLPGRQLRRELMVMRKAEFDQVYLLLEQYINDNKLSVLENEAQLACQLISCGCLGSAHLWHDLGFPERPRLTEFFTFYFPELTALNSNNMRWKRFLYKQLCENGGDYVCRSPSCETCSSYHECFISE